MDVYVACLFAMFEGLMFAMIALMMISVDGKLLLIVVSHLARQVEN